MVTWLFLAAINLANLQLPVMNGAANEVFEPKDERVFVIEAYFNTCPYCNENAPNVDRLAADYDGDARVKVLDVGIDRSITEYESWIRKHNPNHPVLKDDKRKLISQLGTTSYPSTYVLDADGNVKFRSVGSWNSSTEQKIRKAIDDILVD